MNVAARIDALSFETIETELDDTLLTLRISRPHALNALSPQVIRELREAVSTLRGALGPASSGDSAPDWSIRGIIITGAGGRAFIAGADITEMRSMSREAALDYARDAHELTTWLEELPVPVIAAVNGFALGGGLELAMACDFILASENAIFGQPEVGLGLIPGFGGCVRLQRFVGAARARELILTGSKIDAEQALRIGLISRVLPDTHALLEAAHETARQSAAQAPTAVAAAKRTIRATRLLPDVEALAYERESFADCFDTADSAAGMLAFTEKRNPNFPGS